MELSHLHFANPLWWWCCLAIPVIWIAFLLFQPNQHHHHRLNKLIDSHLLPYLLVNNKKKKNSLWKMLLLWTAVWFCLTGALAGPRWNYREIETFSRDQSLVILLDLSESMNGNDVKPSRLIRAKQKIEDLLVLAKGVKIGLIAFAADPHMITPLTDDKETIRHLLPSLETDLIHVQGSRLSPALEMASTLLDAISGNNKAILVISDGGFEDAAAISKAKKLADKGFQIYTMGVGTVEGAPLLDHEGNLIRKNGVLIVSKLDKERLSQVSKAGNGHYLEAHYSGDEETFILKELEKRADAQMNIGSKNKLWDERFYLLILPVLPIILWWFKRGFLFAIFLVLLLPNVKLQASIEDDYFKNSEQLSQQALENGEYEKAINGFQDPYRKGVAYYRSGKFSEAEEMFRQSSRQDVAVHAAYNLGNSLVFQQKLEEAITAYEELLKDCPDHTRAKHNLELVKKMLEQQKPESSQSDQSEKNKDQEKDQTEKDKQDKGQNSKDSNESQQEQKEGQDKGQDKEPNSEKEPEQEDKESEKNADKQESEEEKKQQESTPEEQKGQPDERDLKEEADNSTDEKEKETKATKSQQDYDADLWLNQIEDEPKNFLKNKFYIESKKNGTTKGVDPW